MFPRVALMQNLLLMWRGDTVARDVVDLEDGNSSEDGSVEDYSSASDGGTLKRFVPSFIVGMIHSQNVGMLYLPAMQGQTRKTSTTTLCPYWLLRFLLLRKRRALLLLPSLWIAPTVLRVR